MLSLPLDSDELLVLIVVKRQRAVVRVVQRFADAARQVHVGRFNDGIAGLVSDGHDPGQGMLGSLPRFLIPDRVEHFISVLGEEWPCQPD
jgi:hypothetical protein